MALTSPGVEVTVIDQSQYLPAAPGSVPFVLVATAQDKADPNGTGIAQGTTAANANKLYEVTSQRDLTTLFGTPTFYTTTNGTPIQGYELNEYGLLAAYSVLGLTNRCYVLRADVDLASLVGQTGRPVGAPENGTYWLDTVDTTWGIYEWNSTTGSFTLQSPIVITDSTDLTSGVPLQTIGQQGNYAVVALSQSGETPIDGKQFFFKTTTNTWAVVGSEDWYNDWPVVQGTISNPVLESTDVFNLDFNGTTVQVTVGGTSLSSVVTAINTTLGWGYLTAAVRNGKICFFSTYPESDTPVYITFSENTGTPLADMGITPNVAYYVPKVTYGTSAQQPTWQAGQTYPRPTGSVWFKVGGNGLVPQVEEYSSTLESWVAKTVTLATSDQAAIAALDPTGGQAIPAGTVYGQYNFNSSYLTTAPVYLWKRTATGATVITGTNTSPVFTGLTGSAPWALTVYVSEPNTAVLDGPYTVTIQNNDDASDFVIRWSAAAIPNTTAAVATSGAIQITHTEGGVIVIDDVIATGGDKGKSSGVLVEAGLIAGTTDGVKYGSAVDFEFAAAPSTFVTGTGTGATFNVTILNGKYVLDSVPVAAGTGYDEGNTLKILGTDLGGATPANDLTLKVAEIVGSVPFVLSTVAITGTAGQFSCAASSQTLVVDMPVIVSGTLTGSGTITGYSNPTTYYIIATNGSTTFTLSASLGGGAITTTAGSTTGLTFTATEPATGPVQKVQYVSGDPAAAVVNYEAVLSNWVEFTYTANDGRPVAEPANNTNWFYSVIDEVDIMVNYNGAWKGYKNQNYDLNGFPTPTGSNATDPAGPIVSASAPETQSDGTALVYGDLWIDTSNLDNYPVIYRWQSVNGDNQWVLIDNSDQTNPSGIVFADARWATNGTTSVTDDPIPTIASLLTSNYLDLDAPDDALYPTGMLLFNTRRSGYNVKQFRVNYFNATSFPDASLPTEKNAWVTVSGNMDNGAPYMGRKAQRAMVVEGMRAAIDTNTEIRDEDNFFNLMAAPNYPELQPNMIVLNSDRGETGYILGDTPLGLSDSANAITAWATNAAGASSTGEEGLVTRNTYMGLFYPSGRTSDLSGNLVAVPASHMMLRTFVRNDNIAYPWLAAAGTRRGVIDNATNIGYVNRQTGEFVAIKTRVGIRDVLYNNFINPLVFFTGQGLLNYGNKTSFNSQSALDRTNVARLVAYIRRQLTLAARPFIFEPNDAFTRSQVKSVCESLMVDLVAKRGVFDYLVVCDDSNNTPERIDRNELWVDIAIEPVKAVEFIYIPVRILNTGELSS